MDAANLGSTIKQAVGSEPETQPVPRRAGILSPPRSRPAYHYLIGFAVALLVPMLIFTSLMGWQLVGSERSRAIETTRSATRALSLAVERELLGPDVALRTLARAPSLREGDLASFYTMAKDAAEALGLVIVVRKPGEKLQLLDTSVPWGVPIAGGSPDIANYELQAISAHKTVVTGLITGPRNEKPMIALVAPIYQGDKAVLVLSVDIHADQFERVLQQVPLPPGWVSGLVDQNGKIIARSDGNDKFVGLQASADWYQAATQPSGIWRGVNLEGNEVLVSHVRSSETGWIVSAAVPAVVLDAPLWQASVLLFAVGAALLLIASGLAYWLGARLSNAIWSLNGAARRYSVLHENSAVSTPVSEINEVGAALRQAVQETEEGEAQLKSIMATSPSAMVVIDSLGIVQTFSHSAETVFGYSAAEVVGTNVKMLMPEPDRSLHDGYLERFLTTGEKRIIGVGRVVTGMRKDGTKFPVELHIGEARVGERTLFTAFMRDQTDKYRIEHELRQTQKMEAIGKLTGGVAHDFNNLLTVIKGNLEMLEEFIGENERELLRDSQQATDLAAKLTTSLLAFGRRMPLNPTRTNVGDLVASTSDMLRRTLGETIEVTTSIIKVSPTVVDSGQLQSALLNLAINARDAMPKGGKLSIAISDVELDEDYAASYGEVRPGRYVMISMTDTGTGMTKEIKDRAFEPFFTTKPQGSGTGLGLSSVYGFVKQSGGHAAIYSEQGQGTTIRLYLQAASANQAETGDSADEKRAMPRGAGQVVLVVEDDALVRRVTVARLKSLGYQVLEADNGPSAVEILQLRTDIDLLFTDMVMPGGMSGAELANLGRSLRPDLRILFTSGYAEADMMQEAKSSSETWLKKPYTAAQLANRLSAILSR